jgi:hypothetical protein
MRMLKKLTETAYASIMSGKMQKISCRCGGKANCLTLRIKQFAFPYLPNLFFYRPLCHPRKRDDFYYDLRLRHAGTINDKPIRTNSTNVPGSGVGVGGGVGVFDVEW